MISSAAVRVSSLPTTFSESVRIEHWQRLTYLTNAIILGGWLSLVWKKRLLLIV